MTLLLMDKEEGPVLPDWASEPSAVTVIAPFRILCRDLMCKRVRALVAKPVVSVQLVILVVPVAGPMPIVATPARDHLNLGAKRSGKVHTGVVRLHPELFQAFHRRWDNGSWGRAKPPVTPAAALHIARGVATIEHEGVLVHPSPGYRSAARVALARSAGSVETRNRHGLEQHQGSGIPA